MGENWDLTPEQKEILKLKKDYKRDGKYPLDTDWLKLCGKGEKPCSHCEFLSNRNCSKHKEKIAVPTKSRCSEWKKKPKPKPKETPPPSPLVIPPSPSLSKNEIQALIETQVKLALSKMETSQSPKNGKFLIDKKALFDEIDKQRNLLPKNITLKQVKDPKEHDLIVLHNDTVKLRPTGIAPYKRKLAEYLLDFLIDNWDKVVKRLS